MRTLIAYCFPQVEHRKYEPLAQRFAQSYIRHPPGQTDHDLYVVSNGGGRITPRQEQLFEPLAPNYVYWNNVGRDVGAYQHVANIIPCDFLVCIGSPVRPVCAGWLDMLVCALEQNGPGLFGFWGFSEPAVHIRTTAFAISTEVLKMYPREVDDRHRYDFEFGPNSITKFCLQNGLAVQQVTKRGAFLPKDWHFVEPEESLLYDQFADKLGWKDNARTERPEAVR